MDDAYKKQVSLLLDILPEVSKETCFAMHGGTAINLFVRDMPRLSVDIDLTYVVIEGRAETLSNINQALIRIKEGVETLKPSARVVHKNKTSKLQISDRGVQIKIEVNMVGRGVLEPGEKAVLCTSAQEQFDAFCSMALVPLSQLYGGKICAALDRQHPRDLFDVKLLFENEGFSDEIKHGFLLCLMSSNRPTHELLSPRLQDQRAAFENQFEGMSAIPFSYEDYEQTRLALIKAVNGSLNEQDKAFLLSVNKVEPDWGIYDFKRFPSVQWKLKNLVKFQEENQLEYEQQFEKLKAVLNPV
jgi:predicted nucleotidyltransferase component of viral defense system